MDVQFVTAMGQVYTVQIWYFATVREIKEEVRRQTGIPVKQLRFKGKELKDDLDTEHYSILEGSRILMLTVG